MQIADIFTGLRFEAPQKRKRVTERGELLSYFQAKINAGRVGTKYRQVSVSQLAFTLSHLKKIDDLRFIKSLCDQEEIRGKEWSMVFYSSLKVKK